VAVRTEGGFLWVRPELQERIDPLVVTWGFEEGEFARRHLRSGTRDPAAWLSVPAAIEFQREWGWDEVRERCHALVERFVAECGLPVAARPFGQMAAVEVPGDGEEMQRRLWEEHRIEIPGIDWHGRQLLRISVQGYNTDEDVEALLSALGTLDLPRL
jgi:isopenicillin-N epimerase